MNPSVAVVILNYNTKYFLEKFLKSVVNSSYSNFQVYVADNSSKDESVQFIIDQYPQIKLIVLEKNYGFTGGYNRALKQINSDYYILLNSDVEVKYDWIEPLVELAEKTPNIGAIQPKILDFKNTTKFEYAGACGGFIDKYGFPFCRGRIFESLEEDFNQYDDEKEIFWATGASMFVKADLYHQLGGLDEDFFAHMEEIDFCWRLHQHGYKVMVCPKSVVYHVGGGTLQKSNPKKTYYNFRNGLILLIKNLPSNKLVPILLMRLLLDHIAAYRWLFQGKFGDFFAVAKAHRHFVFRLKYWFNKRDKVNKKVYNSSLIYKKSIALKHYLNKVDKYNELTN
jgi:GT2 family glycosyltransferase